MKKYVYYNRNYYFTNDNWESYLKSKSIPGIDYISEANRDIIVKFKLIDCFGIEQAEELVRTLENIRKNIKLKQKKK